jgi:FlaA1/EpsC-like NDP-sugar epimerase
VNAGRASILPRPFARLGHYAITRKRPTKRWIVMLVDAGLCATCCFVSVFLRLGFIPERDTPFGPMIAISIAIALPVFHLFGLYREIFSQAGIRALVQIGRAVAVYTLPFATVFSYVGIFGIPRTVTLIQPILLFVAVAGSRVFARYWLFGTETLRRVPRRRVIIYGAGSAGRQLAGAIVQSGDIALVGYLDDDPALIGSILDGCRIYSPEDIGAALTRLSADEILLALPSASRERRNAIISAARRSGARVRTLPGIMDIAHGRVEMAHIRDVEIEDLLGRESVAPDPALMARAIRGRIVLVTGAGGSIGGEICRQLLALEPALLLLVEINEFGLYEIHRELVARAGDNPDAPRIIPLLGSVVDEARMDDIVGTWRPDILYHAAAYKHVPLVEHNPAEAVRTNILGTLALARVAARWRVPDFILISTDKAVRPTSIMGATKRAAELVLQALNAVSPATRFSMVRFGNVLGSSGSVVPLFRQQIRAGGPVTVTDRRMTRYFMTVPEAAELVLQAGAMAEGGEVFVLDMGAPVRIIDLARNMIELAGYGVRDEADPAGDIAPGDIAIVEIGLRPGEKLYEELLLGDGAAPTGHPRILKADESFLPLDRLRPSLDRIARLLDERRCIDLVAALRELVPEFDHAGGLVDWVHLDGERAIGMAPITLTA